MKRLEEMEQDRAAGRWSENVEEIVRRLGYASYKDYLKTPLWREHIWPRIMERDSYTCQCGKKATQVHHHDYTEAVMRGDDDSLLISLCVTCHKIVEFDGRRRRTIEEKRQVIANLKERARLSKFSVTPREVSRGRCYWCRGITDSPPWVPKGIVVLIPTLPGDEIGVWMCIVCASTLDRDQSGRTRSDDEKIALLSKKTNSRYNRRKPSRTFRFNAGFWKLNAMQRELLMAEYEQNCATLPPLKSHN